METAKAVVEVPSPVSGKVLKLAGNAGDVITTGALLAEFEIDASKPQRAEGHDTGHHHAVKPAAKAADAAEATAESKTEEATESSRPEAPTSELQTLMRISDAVFCLKKKK